MRVRDASSAKRDRRGVVVHSRLPACEVTREARTEHRGVRPYVLRERGRHPQRDGRTHCARAARARDGTALAHRAAARTDR
jgi:hypothetical protein